MGNPAQDVHHEAVKLAQHAEIATPQALQQVHSELQKDMKTYSAADYGKLLNGIQQQNASDVKANSHLPSLNLYDGGKAGVKDSVSARYSDGTTVTTQGAGAQGSGDGKPGLPSGADHPADSGHKGGATGGSDSAGAAAGDHLHQHPGLFGSDSLPVGKNDNSPGPGTAPSDKPPIPINDKSPGPGTPPSDKPPVVQNTDVFHPPHQIPGAGQAPGHQAPSSAPSGKPGG